MSVWRAGRTTLVKCDGPGCYASVARSATMQAHKDARRSGWALTAQGDFCPRCLDRAKIAVVR